MVKTKPHTLREVPTYIANYKHAYLIHLAQHSGTSFHAFFYFREALQQRVDESRKVADAPFEERLRDLDSYDEWLADNVVAILEECTKNLSPHFREELARRRLASGI